MTRKEFIKILDKGFTIDDVKGNDSKLRCFACGEVTKLIKVNRRSKIRCNNKHTFSLIDFVIKHTQNRNGLLIMQNEEGCGFNFKK